MSKSYYHYHHNFFKYVFDNFENHICHWYFLDKPPVFKWQTHPKKDISPARKTWGLSRQQIGGIVKQQSMAISGT